MGIDKATISEVMSEMGRRGGEKRVPKGFSVLNNEERAANSKKAADARWAKKKARPVVKKATAKKTPRKKAPVSGVKEGN